MKKHTKGIGLSAIALAVAMTFGGASFASADELVPAETVDTTTVEQVEVAPVEEVTEVAPVEEVVEETAPVVEPVVVEEAAPVVEQAPVQAQTFTGPVGPVTPQPEVISGWHSWLMPEKGDWPQKYIGTGQVAPKCGERIQQDYYVGTQAMLDAVIADGVLLNPAEDAKIVKDWKIVVGAKCGPTEITVPTLTVTPPTCDTNGSLPFIAESTGPAQNPNGYEFLGKGYRVYLDKAYTGPGTYVATIQKVGPGFDPAFPYGTKVVGQTKQTLVVEPATNDCPANPVAVVTPSCGEASIVLTNPEPADLTAAFVINVDGKFYEAVTVEAGQQATRTLTFNEDSGDHKVEVFQAGTSEWKLIGSATVTTDCIPPLPEPQTTPVVGYAADCDGVITKTTVVYSTPWIWNGEKYVLDEDNTKAGEPTTEVVDISEVPEDAEIFVPTDCETEEPPTTEPPVVVPPTTQPPVVTPSTDPTPVVNVVETPAAPQAELAVTGANDLQSAAIAAGGLVLTLVGVLLVAVNRRRDRQGRHERA